jgi:serine protease AprX
VDDATTSLRVTLVGSSDVPGLPDASVRPRAFTDLDGAVVTVAGGLEEARGLARQPRVYSIADAGEAPALRDEQSAQIVAQGTAEPLGPGYPEFLELIGADGSGVILANVDGGVDFNHPDLADRIEACIDYSHVQRLCEAGNHDDVIGHGTHTLGVKVGTGASGFGDLDGFTYGQGMAPGATAVVQNALHTPGGFSNAFGDGWRPPYRESYELGAIVSGNSWGPSGQPQGYDDDTREFDTIPRDIVDDSGVDDPQAFVLSIMNGRGGTSTQGTPDEAKNLIRVGGTVSRDPVGGLEPDDLCFCTAHGPALDGRLLPDLVAPGQQVVSTRATQGTLCGLPFVGWVPDRPAMETPPSPLHAGCTGTSMASPHVTGGYAVFVDWYRQNVADDPEEATPSPALVKAAFVNGADDLAGARNADNEPMDHIPNNEQGWGRFNLGNVIESWKLGAVHVDQSHAFTESGESFDITVTAVDPDQPIKATLVWTDAPGHGQGGELPAWVNDLDLVVVAADGTTWLGNVFEDGWSATGGEPDRMNNVENVYLPEAGDGTYQVTVEAANIIGQASPNVLSPTWQDFALVITNAELAD